MSDRRISPTFCALLLAVCSGEAHAACAFTPQGDGRVSAVLDARTFRLDDGREVRLAGIEVRDDILTHDIKGHGIKGRDIKGHGGSVLESLIAGREVTLHGADDKPDRYGRQPAFVFVKHATVSIQAELLGRGDALVSAAMTGPACAAALLAAEATARAAKRGMWAGSAALKNAETPNDILTGLGRFTVVEGTVSSARLAGATFYVNFGRRGTQGFAVTVSRRMMPSFEAAGIDLKSLKDKKVQIRGWIEKRAGSRIELSHPGQIEVIAAGTASKDGLTAKAAGPRDEGK